MTTKEITKKEYLKKYLSGGDKKKKKKKVVHSTLIKSRIVDDDIDLKNMKPVDDSELEIFDLAEEAPQIAGIIDERPEEVRILSEYRSTKKWKIIADEYEDVKITALDRGKENGEVDSDTSPPRRNQKVSNHSEADSRRSSRKEIDSDESPPRRHRKESPPRKKGRQTSPDASPPRRSRGARKEIDSDESPPRRHRKESPPRKSRKQSSSDASPPRKSRKNQEDSDESPPRKNRRVSSSPPRRKKPDSDSSPPRRKDASRNFDRRERPPAKDHYKHRDSDRGGRRRRSRSSSSETNKRRLSKPIKEEPSSPRHRGTQKTLEGKSAGLQDSSALRRECEELRQKQNDTFAKMSDDLSGRNAAAIVRDRKTGRRRDLKEEARKRREKDEKNAERLAQYAVWGKGVKQVEDRQEKIKDDLYEMSKPLARYKDDKDLDEMLKNQEWDGDPMLEYIRKKRKEKEGGDGRGKTQYEGAYLPNRHGIKPGYRWDGVDRSNGFEKKWFDEQNDRKALEEEAFKWSTADM